MTRSIFYVLGVSVIFVLTILVSSPEVSANYETETIDFNFTGSCAFKGWASVAVCRKDFVDRLEGKDNVGQCCLYRILQDCARRNAVKLCGNVTDLILEKHLQKYQDMMDPKADCSSVTVDSWACFWTSWENYVSCFIFLLFTLVIDIYIVIWYTKYTNVDREDKKSLV